MHQESLDKRERKFVAGVAAGKPLRQAAKDAGYATSTAEKKTYKILRAPREQSFLTNSLEQAGITAKKIAAPDGRRAASATQGGDQWAGRRDRIGDRVS